VYCLADLSLTLLIQFITTHQRQWALKWPEFANVDHGRPKRALHRQTVKNKDSFVMKTRCSESSFDARMWKLIDWIYATRKAVCTRQKKLHVK
jgi:hypothetical protein